LARLRYDLADKLLDAYRVRKQTVSGRLAIAAAEAWYRVQFPSELARIQEESLHLRNLMEERRRRQLIAIELQRRCAERQRPSSRTEQGPRNAQNSWSAACATAQGSAGPPAPGSNWCDAPP